MAPVLRAFALLREGLGRWYCGVVVGELRLLGEISAVLTVQKS